MTCTVLKTCMRPLMIINNLQARPRCSQAITACTAAAPRCHPITYHADFQLSPLPDGHRFPMPKDHLLFERLQSLNYADACFEPRYPDADTLCLIHNKEYVDAFLDGSIAASKMRQIGLPWSEKLVRRTLIGVGSAILAARLALQYGVAVMCNGGTHHAHADHGSGWCIFNDQACAARAAQRDAGVERVLFVDLDVHQGDGTAAIFANDPSVFTLSLHCAAQSFPSPLQRGDLDIALPAGTGDEAYLEVLRDVLPSMLARVRPDLVMYNAGVDVHRDDALGKLALSNEGILERDRCVFAACADAGVPVACAIGGGYAEDHASIVDRHVLTHTAARQALPRLARVAEERRRRLLNAL